MLSWNALRALCLLPGGHLPFTDNLKCHFPSSPPSPLITHLWMSLGVLTPQPPLPSVSPTWAQLVPQHLHADHPQIYHSSHSFQAADLPLNCLLPHVHNKARNMHPSTLACEGRDPCPDLCPHMPITPCSLVPKLKLREESELLSAIHS